MNTECQDLNCFCMTRMCLHCEYIIIYRLRKINNTKCKNKGTFLHLVQIFFCDVTIYFYFRRFYATIPVEPNPGHTIIYKGMTGYENAT